MSVRKLLVATFVILWLIGWASIPGASAVHGAEDLGNQLHKIFVRGCISILVFSGLYLKFRSKTSVWKPLVFPVLFVFYNLLTLPISSNLVYSGFRLYELILIIGSAYLVIDISKETNNINNSILLVFKVFTIELALLVIIFLVDPQLGGKAAGWDESSQQLKYRLGGSFLRVDIVSALASASAIFWLFGGLLNRWESRFVSCVGLLFSILALVLSHSRTALILTTIISVYFLFFKEKNSYYRYIILISPLVFLALYFSFGPMLDFYMRGETIENISTGSGRLFLAESLLELNSWYSFIIGNGYLMNWSGGLIFPVPKMGVYMSQPHNGYLSVLFGSGAFGLILILIINLKIWGWLRTVTSGEFGRTYLWMKPVYLTLAGITFFDYGIWGVANPSMLIFFVLYFMSAKLHRIARTSSGV